MGVRETRGTLEPIKPSSLADSGDVGARALHAHPVLDGQFAGGQCDRPGDRAGVHDDGGRKVGIRIHYCPPQAARTQIGGRGRDVSSRLHDRCRTHRNGYAGREDLRSGLCRRDFGAMFEPRSKIRGDYLFAEKKR